MKRLASSLVAYLAVIGLGFLAQAVASQASTAWGQVKTVDPPLAARPAQLPNRFFVLEYGGPDGRNVQRAMVLGSEEEHLFEGLAPGPGRRVGAGQGRPRKIRRSGTPHGPFAGHIGVLAGGCTVEAGGPTLVLVAVDG